MAVLNAQGATFTFEDGASSPVVVGGIKSFSGLSGESTIIDISTLASTAKEFRQGLQDFGNFEMDIMRDPQDVGQLELESAKAAQATRECVLTLPSGDIATFNAFVVNLTSEGGVDAVVTGKCTMKITGPVVWTN